MSDAAADVLGVRPLTDDDIMRGAAEPGKGLEPPSPLQKIRDTHHMLARALASGASEHEASLHTGYSYTRIQMLRTDPAFQELIEYYRGIADQAFADIQGRMAAVSGNVLSIIQERLEDDTHLAAMSTNSLMRMFEGLADRTGNGIKSTLVTEKREAPVDLSSLTAEQRAMLREVISGPTAIEGPAEGA